MKKLPAVLASASPRRQDLLRRAGIPFQVFVPKVNETVRPGAFYRETALENALLKAEGAALVFPDAVVIGADTVIELDGEILGKPRDEQDAFHMLRRLSGRTHEVVTGVAVLVKNGNIRIRFADGTKVTFKTLTDEVIRAYLKQVNVLDKAGAYGIQECGDRLLDHLEGSVNNVIGLPVERLSETLRLNALA